MISADTTPSRGNTPIHHCSFKETHHLEKPLYMDSSSNPILEPSKTDMKKQIIELFQESSRDDAIDDSQNLQERSKVHPTICPLSSKSTNKNLHRYVTNFFLFFFIFIFFEETNWNFINGLT